jgi:hydrogenase maturation protease
MKKKPKEQIAVIGVGNEFRGDDAAGVIAARKIEKENLPGVDVIIQSGEGTALIEAWQSYDLVIIIDASRSNSATGQIFRFDTAEQKLPDSFFNYSTHAFSVAEAVELARVLNRLPPKMIIYAVEGEKFENWVGLSPEVERATENIFRRIRAEILNFLKIKTENTSNN